MKPHRVARVAFLPPGSLDLTFADGAAFLVPIADIGMLDAMLWDTACLYPKSGDVTVDRADGEEILLDAGHLRYLADAEWRREADRELA